MSGSICGQFFKVATFGESHGPALGCVIDGCPPGLALTANDIQHDLNKRKPGTSRFVTQRAEADEVEILSGVFEGQTTGTPIALLIRNHDQRSQDYNQIKNLFRPGHADLSYNQKYGVRDFRGGGRSSARETAARVAAGAIARKWLLTHHNVVIRGYLDQLGSIKIPFISWDERDNPFFAANQAIVTELSEYMATVRAQQDSIGAGITVVADGLPCGWGDPVFDRLDATVAAAMMSINAVKGVEIGDGFAAIDQYGSVHSDEISSAGFLSNHAGGILGGISTGQPLRVRIALKPTSSISQERRTINDQGQDTTIKTLGRHDPCVGIRATPIAEAMLALALIDRALAHRAQCADVIPTTLFNHHKTNA